MRGTPGGRIQNFDFPVTGTGETESSSVYVMGVLDVKI